LFLHRIHLFLHLMLHNWYMIVSGVLQICYRSFEGVLHGCQNFYMGVWQKLLREFRKIQKCDSSATKVRIWSTETGPNVLQWAVVLGNNRYGVTEKRLWCYRVQYLSPSADVIVRDGSKHLWCYRVMAMVLHQLYSGVRE
jgi:hypothetical protein